MMKLLPTRPRDGAARCADDRARKRGVGDQLGNSGAPATAGLKARLVFYWKRSKM